MFFLSTLSIYLYDKKHFNWLFAVIGILLPALLAGARDLQIGADTGGYPIDTFKIACLSKTFLNAIYDVAIYTYVMEQGYVAIVYFISLLSHSQFAFFFFTNIILDVSVFYFLLQAKKKSDFNLWLGWLTYLFLYYNRSLNYSRQSLAIAIALLSIVLLWKHKILGALLIVAIGITVHNSILLVFIYFIENKMKSCKIRKILPFFIIIAIIGGSALIHHITDTIPLLNRFIKYTEDSEGNTEVFELLSRGVALAYLLLLLKSKYIFIYENFLSRCFYLLIIEFALMSCSYIDGRLSRISLYLLPVYFYTIPMYIKQYKKSSMTTFIYICCLLFYWTIAFVVQNQELTIPFSFSE